MVSISIYSGRIENWCRLLDMGHPVLKCKQKFVSVDETSGTGTLESEGTGVGMLWAEHCITP